MGWSISSSFIFNRPYCISCKWFSVVLPAYINTPWFYLYFCSEIQWCSENVPLAYPQILWKRIVCRWILDLPVLHCKFNMNHSLIAKNTLKGSFWSNWVFQFQFSTVIRKESSRIIHSTAGESCVLSYEQKNSQLENK